MAAASRLFRVCVHAYTPAIANRKKKPFPRKRIPVPQLSQPRDTIPILVANAPIPRRHAHKRVDSVVGEVFGVKYLSKKKLVPSMVRQYSLSAYNLYATQKIERVCVFILTCYI